MSVLNSKITDQVLLDLLTESPIDDEQKNQLKLLVPLMDERERNFLYKTLNQANQILENELLKDENYKQKIIEINEKFESQIQQLIHQSVHEGFKKQEQSDRESSENELKFLESEIEKI